MNTIRIYRPLLDGSIELKLDTKRPLPAEMYERMTALLVELHRFVDETPAVADE